MSDAVTRRYLAVRGLLDAVMQQLHETLQNEGFDPRALALSPPEEALYRLEKDPSNGEYSLVGDWIGEHGNKLGSLLFHADGSFFVEHDVVQPHPSKRRWFVEAVNAWGKGGNIKAESRLLPMPE